MINIESRLKEHRIITPIHKYNDRDLNTLKTMIQTEEDWTLYCSIYQKYIKNPALYYILYKFKQAKGVA